MLPAVLVLLAAVADSHGAHALALDALLGAVPFAAVAALAVVRRLSGHARRRAGRAAGAALGVSSVALLVLSCAMRSASIHGVPPLAVSSLVAALALFALKTRRSRSRRTRGASPISGPRSPDAAPMAVRLTTRSERQRSRGSAGDVDQRLHREERADRDDEAARDARPRARSSRGGEPPAGASWSSPPSRMNIARIDREVVGGRDDRPEHADHDQPPPAVLVGGGEGVELADEAAGEREAEEAEHEDPHRDAEERPLPAEARPGCRASPVRRARARARRRRERAERHRAVGDQVVEQRPAAERVGGGDRDQHEARRARPRSRRASASRSAG